ncbi:MAG: hypothetical protein R3C25_07020 [Hyphomonadaceae bacterium]
MVHLRRNRCARAAAFERDGATARVAQYDKPNGALVQRSEYGIGLTEGGAGSVFTALTQNGADAGVIRQTNSGMLETPAAAFTPRIVSVRLGDREITCRWLPRTRIFGFTGRRSFIVHEDADGDLIYTAYDFPAAAAAQPIDLSENGQTTTFSVEVRGGEETMGPDGASFVFPVPGTAISYRIEIRPDRSAELIVAGEPTQSEPLVAYQQGEGAE